MFLCRTRNGHGGLQEKPDEERCLRLRLYFLIPMALGIWSSMSMLGYGFPYRSAAPPVCMLLTL